MSTRRTAILLILVLFAAVALVGCPAADPEDPVDPDPDTEDPDVEDPDPTEPEERELTIGYYNEFNLLDPHKTSAAMDGPPLFALFDGLVDANGSTGEIHPNLATDWSVSEDGTVWTFELKDDVYFHDGTHFDADAVVTNFERIVDPETVSEAARFEIGPFKEARAVGDYTVEIEHEEPYGPFLRGLAHYSVMMVSPAAVEEYGEDFGTENPVGTGPFVFEEWVGGSHARFAKNDEYHGGPDFTSSQAYYEALEFRFIEEDSTRAAALETGEVDVASNMAPADWLRVQDGGFGGHRYDRLGYPPVGLFINVDEEPTDDVRVRRALIHAVDEELVIAVDGEGIPNPSGGVVSRHAWEYNPEAGEMYDYDPEKAAELLDDAGWEMGDDGYREKDGERLELVYLTLTGARSTAEVVEPMLVEIGIDVEILVQDNPMQQNTAQDGDHNLVWTQWGGTDPSALSGRYHSENIGDGWNFCHYANAEIDELFARGERETDPDEREAIYHEIQMILMEDATIVPLHNAAILWNYRDGIEGWEPWDSTGWFGFFVNLHE